MWAEYLPRRFRVEERPSFLEGETYVAGLVCLACGKSFYHRTFDALKHIEKKHGADWVMESRPAQEKVQAEQEERFRKMGLLRSPQPNPAPHTYLKVYFVGKKSPVILRDAKAAGPAIFGDEVNQEGELVSSMKGKVEVLRKHFIDVSMIRKAVPMSWDLHYGELKED